MLSRTLAIITALAAAGSALNVPTSYADMGNRLDCPTSHESLFKGTRGGKWGVLCGFDTVSTYYHWGPYTNLDFEECILECGALEGCEIAAYSGDCYLKKSARGLGYKTTGGNDQYRLAMKLN